MNIHFQIIKSSNRQINKSTNQQMPETIGPDEALKRLQKICSAQEKCPADAITLLKKWGVDQSHHPGIISRLKEEQFINEVRYADAFVRDKIRLDHWGLAKIRYFLRQKGIPESMIGDACDRIDREEYAGMIRRELEKKRKTLKGATREIWTRLARYGASRGYEIDIMYVMLDDLTRKG